MIRLVVIVGACAAVALGLSACGGVPSGVIKGPETPLKFKVAKEKKVLTEENPASGLNIPAERLAAATTTSPANFAVVAAGGSPCNLTENEILNRGESCTIGVEFTSGVAGVKAMFQQKFGPRGEPERLVAEFAIES
jgi:hypothetical protein